jgi:hypothetical protein
MAFIAEKCCSWLITNKGVYASDLDLFYLLVYYKHNGDALPKITKIVFFPCMNTVKFSFKLFLVI